MRRSECEELAENEGATKCMLASRFDHRMLSRKSRSELSILKAPFVQKSLLMLEERVEISIDRIVQLPRMVLPDIRVLEEGGGEHF